MSGNFWIPGWCRRVSRVLSGTIAPMAIPWAFALLPKPVGKELKYCAFVEVGEKLELCVSLPQMSVV